MERGSERSRYHGSKISGSQQSFLTETATCIVERWKKSMGYRPVSKCNHAQESHTVMSLFFLPYLQDHCLLRSGDFATMATSRKHFLSLLKIM